MLILVRGIGDVGSAVAHHLFCAGYPTLIHSELQPSTPRRMMAFTDAVFDGWAVLEGVKAVRVDGLDGLSSVLAARTMIPVLVVEFSRLIQVVAPDILIDARMRKHTQPENQRGLAPLTIGLGPGFIAGETTDLVVETAWGESLGRVITAGAALSLQGEPRPIAGVARERYVYAPVEGVLHTDQKIGARVHRGDTIGYIGTIPLIAPIDGVLRGLTRDGVRVTKGTKVLEVDPRTLTAEVTGIAERPHRIAMGVLQAIETQGLAWT